MEDYVEIASNYLTSYKDVVENGNLYSLDDC